MKPPLKLNPRHLDPKKTLVLVVDVQNDFCHPKSVLKRKRSRNRKVALEIYDFIKKAQKKGAEVAFSQQIFDETRLTRQQKKYYFELLSGNKETFGAYSGTTKVPCVKGTFGAKYFNYKPPKNRLFIKSNFDIWQNKGFASFLAKHKIETLVITGVEILCCVLFAVLGAEERGFRTVIPRDLVSGVDEWKKEGDNLLDILGKMYCPVVSSREILEIWDKCY